MQKKTPRENWDIEDLANQSSYQEETRKEEL